MKKMQLLAHSAFRQARAQTIVLFCLVLIASAMLSLWLMLATDYTSNFDRQHDALHAEHVTCLVSAPKDAVEKMLQPVLDERDDIEDVEYTGGLVVSTTFPYNGSDFSQLLIVLEEDEALNKRIGRVEMTKESPDTDGLSFPLIYEGDLQAGSTASLTLDGYTGDYTIHGFFNSIMAGSHNCALTEMLASKATYEALETDGIGVPGTLCSIRVTDLKQCTDVRSEVVRVLSEKFPEAYIASSRYAQVRTSRYVSSGITSGVFSGAAALLLFVALIIGASNVATHIQRTMPDFGILKATGYTGRALVGSVVWQYVLISVPGALAGNAAAYALYPAIAASMVLQTGIPYEVHFMAMPVVLSTVVCVGAFVLASWLAARRIQKIDPVTALRSGTPVHNFRKNRFPLDTSRRSANVAMGLKEAASSPRRNVILCVSMCFLSLLLVLSAVLIQSVFVDFTPMLELMGLELVDVEVTVTDAKDEQEVLRVLDENPAIDRYYLFSEASVPEPNGPGVVATIIDSGEDVVNQSVLFEGRWPKYANEAAMGAKHAETLGYEIGDEIALGPADHERKYLLVGLSQMTNYLGDDVWLTREAYEEMAPLSTPKYLVLLKEGEDRTVVVEELEETLTDAAAIVSDRRDMVTTVAMSYISAMQMIAFVLLILCALMTLLVIYLVVRTAVQTRLREYGLLKALGYRTRDLMTQTVLSLTPALSISIVLSLLVWSCAINPIFAVFFNGMGLRESHFVVPALLIAVLGAVLFALAMCLTLILASRIRKVSPARLLSEE